ncbi:hypothetical protein D3C81_1990270 [compost metagenome]
MGPLPDALTAAVRGAEPIGHLFELLAGKREIVRAKFQQFPGELQTGQTPGGTPSTTDP